MLRRESIFLRWAFLFYSTHGRRLAAAYRQHALPRGHALAQSKGFGYFVRMETMIELEDELLAEAKHFAERSHCSLSEVVAEALHEKLSKSNGETPAKQKSSSLIPGLHPDIRCLTGLVPADLDAKTVYHEHLARRHK
jgi:hypothetical protein